MRLLIQRVSQASVSINGKIKSAINHGLLIFVGIEDPDTFEDIHWLINKTINLRIFNDENNVMNCSLLEVNGALLVVSQFTLFASTKKGNRPSYLRSSKPDIAIPLYEAFLNQLSKAANQEVQSGTFGADMKVELLNDGPVTIIMDSKNKE